MPYIKRRCLTYRPNDLILCNTNNGTERLNEDLKYDELKGLMKQTLLSEVLVILVNSFKPKHYENYIKFNLCYGNGCKRYASDIPYFLKNRPKKIVEILLLEKMYTVVPKAEINRLDQYTFKVNHDEECTGIKKEYEVFLGSESKFCSCSCHDFRRYRILCKHFFRIFKSKLAKFYDLSPLFVNHLYVILDHSMFGNNNETDSSSWKDETPSNKMVEEVDKLNNEFPQNTETIYTTHRDDLNMKSSVTKQKKSILEAT